MPVFKEFLVKTFFLNNRIFCFDSDYEIFIDVEVRKILKDIDNFLHIDGSVRFSNFHYPIKNLDLYKFSIEQIENNPFIVILSLLPKYSYLLTGLKSKMIYNKASYNNNNINNIVIKSYIKRNNNYIAIYDDSSVACTATCGQNNLPTAFSDTCVNCSSKLQNICNQISFPDQVTIDNFKCPLNT
tara:strand:+ start:2131 stop:2685 length:555 start_codon:yes stop_codon:yes gene_type:complete